MRYYILAAITALLQLQAKASYDPINGEKALYYSASAYCNKTTLSDWSCGTPCDMHNGITNIVKLECRESDAFGFVAYN